MLKFWQYEINNMKKVQEEALLEKELEEYEAELLPLLDLEDLTPKSITWQPPTPSMPNLPKAEDCKSFPLVADPRHKDGLWSTSELPDVDPKTQNYEENLSYCTNPVQLKKWEKIVWHPQKKTLSKRGICQHSSIKYAEADAKRMLRKVWDLAMQGRKELIKQMKEHDKYPDQPEYLDQDQDSSPPYPHEEQGSHNAKTEQPDYLEKTEELKNRYPDNRMSAFVTVCKDPKADGGFWAMFNQRPRDLDTILSTVRIDTYTQTLNAFQVVKEEHNRAGYTPAWSLCLIGENETVDLKRYNWSYKRMIDQLFEEYDPSLYKIGFVEIPDSNAFSCDVEYSELVEEYETHKAHQRFIH